MPTTGPYRSANHRPDKATRGETLLHDGVTGTGTVRRTIHHRIPLSGCAVWLSDEKRWAVLTGKIQRTYYEDEPELRWEAIPTGPSQWLLQSDYTTFAGVAEPGTGLDADAARAIANANRLDYSSPNVPQLDIKDGRSQRWKDAEARCAASHCPPDALAIVEEEQARHDADAKRATDLLNSINYLANADMAEARLVALFAEIRTEMNRVGHSIHEERGLLIVRHATLGMRLVQLQLDLPDIEKQARKTPRRDMPEERAKVEAAKARIEPLRAEIATLLKEHAELYGRLTALGAYGVPCPDSGSVQNESASTTNDQATNLDTPCSDTANEGGT